MVRKKIIQIVFSIILCGSLIFLTACQSKEEQRKSKIDQETTRVAKEIDEKLKIKGYTSETIAEALMDIYYSQDQIPRKYLKDKFNGIKDYREVVYSDTICSEVIQQLKVGCDEVRETAIFREKSIIDYPVIKVDIVDFKSYKNYEEWKELKTEKLLDKKHALLETRTKSQFIMKSENNGYVKTQTKTDSEPQKIENLIPETIEADRYEFMYTVFTKLNIPEN